MKPMIALVIFGTALLGGTFILARSHFDGVVEERTYEAALKYDETVINVNNIEKALGLVKTERFPGGTSVNFVFNPSQTIFPDASIKNAKLIRPGGGKEYILEKSGADYRFLGKIPAGWYNLELLCDLGNNYVSVSKSLYID